MAEERSHYTGVLTLKEIPNREIMPSDREFWLVEDYSYKLYHIVDGQQRLGTPLFQTVRKSQTPPHGYRSAVAYDPTTKTWITVGPNGADISRDDGRNWIALKPSAQDPPDANKDWNALSLPFVVGPHGRIGKLNAKTLAP